jgi:hypothetical protein
MNLGRPGQTVKMWLQAASPLCGAEPPVTRHLICKLDGTLVRLEFSADGGVVTGLVVRPTSFVIDDFIEEPGKRPTRKKMPVPAGEIHLAIRDIKAFGYVENTTTWIQD